MSAKQPCGAVVVHGFSANPAAVAVVADMTRSLGLPTRTPVLRGHNTVPSDMLKVTKDEWISDARDAVHEVLEEADSVVLIGHSMGALVSIVLACEEALKGKVKGLIVLCAPPLLGLCD